MNQVRLPGGGKAWFVRTGKGSQCGLKPASREGHLLTAVFAVVVGAIALYFASGDTGATEIAAWVVLTFAAAFLYIVTALRMSARAPETARRTKCS